MSLSFPKDDMMDVVATTQPNHGKGIPGSDELAAPAQRLLKDKRANYHSRLHIDHLTTLLRMLTRVRLYEPTWGRPNLHYGTLEEPRPQQDELVNILTKQSQISEGFLVPDSVSRVFDILPNMELHFHQLWAIIFQPPVPETMSLFVPPGTQFHGKPEFHRKLRPISFETTYKSSTQESIPNLDLTHLMKGLGDRGSEHRPHLVLFLGDQTQRQGHVPDVIGALCAATPKEESGQQQDISEKTGNSRPSHPQVGPPQLLFQLQPNLRIFRLKEANTASHSSSNGTTKGHVHDMAGKSWIGDSKASGIGLEIDPTTSQMMFVLNQVNQDRNIYNDVLQIDKNSEISGEKLSENIREGFRGSEVVVYRVDGGDEFDPWLANKDGVIRRI
ncbi:hypothetical protein N7471_004729 [Penicillium samsonianum]|uniref:uncharacterized protein n=1 Tax=Penicillium samsonianum TaxID=1882272 RepID=UPI00254978E5|nr:uncharacterized protein N7471_004729 [Penicillium samsonianum]KAJ6138243.1 hypothetical protein N7471_004729 [Penicillium samsonianum]